MLIAIHTHLIQLLPEQNAGRNIRPQKIEKERPKGRGILPPAWNNKIN